MTFFAVRWCCCPMCGVRTGSRRGTRSSALNTSTRRTSNPWASFRSESSWRRPLCRPSFRPSPGPGPRKSGKWRSLSSRMSSCRKSSGPWSRASLCPKLPWWKIQSLSLYLVIFGHNWLFVIPINFLTRYWCLSKFWASLAGAGVDGGNVPF